MNCAAPNIRTKPGRDMQRRRRRWSPLPRRAARSAIPTACRPRFATSLNEELRADRRAGLRAVLSDRARHCAVSPATETTFSARAAARRRIRSSAIASASPRSSRTKVDLLFERFVSAERARAARHRRRFRARAARGGHPVHLSTDTRRERAALAATVICYRGRSAIREVGKVFGLSDDALGASGRHAMGLVGGRRQATSTRAAPVSTRPIRGWRG